MRSVKWFRIAAPIKARRILCVLSLFVGLYFLFTFVLNFKDFTVKTPVNGASWLKLVRVNSSLASNGDNRISQNYLEDVRGPHGPRTLSVHGFLNCHTWAFACKLSLQKFLQHPLFPISPNAQQFVDSLEMKKMGKESKDLQTFGRRIFGYIFPPVTGKYKFSMLTSCDVELWLSADEKWESSPRLLFKARQNDLSTTDSNMQSSSELYSSEIHLRKNHFYFLEILLTHVPHEYFYLNWKLPNSKKFEEISRKYLYSFMEKYSEFKEFIKNVPLTPITQSYINSHPKHSILSSTRSLLSSVKYVEWRDLKLALPMCRYQPGYVGKRVLHQYYAVEHFVNPSYLYPEVKHPQIKDGKWDPWFPLDENEALNIVERYMKHLEDAYTG